MKMDEGLDTGPMLLRRELNIDRRNAGEVTHELAKLGAVALVDWLRDPTPPVPQPDEGATYASKIDKSEARIDWGRPAGEIDRKVRAFNPVPGAWFEACGERLKLLEAVPEEGGTGKPGEVLDDKLTIACGSGSVRPVLLQRAGRAPMTTADLLRGFHVPRGSVLS
jgi:methionyl-tRNA formyltransferase